MADKNEYYNLTPEETGAFQGMSNQMLAAKLTIYDLTEKLAEAQKDRDRTQANFVGALALLAQSKTIPGGALSPDFKRLTPPQE